MGGRFIVICFASGTPVVIPAKAGIQWFIMNSRKCLLKAGICGNTNKFVMSVCTRLAKVTHSVVIPAQAGM